MTCALERLSNCHLTLESGVLVILLRFCIQFLEKGSVANFSLLITDFYSFPSGILLYYTFASK